MNDISIIYNLITEAETLSFKIVRLEEFMKNDSYADLPLTQQELLSEQYDIMRDYLTVLLRRIYYMNEGKENEM